MDDGHFIDDPLMVVGVKPDFTNLGLEKKPYLSDYRRKTDLENELKPK